MPLQLTPEQQEQLKELEIQWEKHTFSTQPADRAKAEMGIALAYELAGHKPPKEILWLDSPLAGAKEAAKLSGLSLAEMMGSCGYGSFDGAWMLYYDAYKKFGLTDSNLLDGILELTLSCGWWWPLEDLAILTERPQILSFDARTRLHATEGPAVRYPDGWQLYFWHGVEMPKWAIETPPDQLNPHTIITEQNIEVRRVLLERAGWDRVISELGLSPIHQDDYGTLYQQDLSGDEALKIVHVVNSTPEPDGTRHQFFLRVPPNVTTAKEAVAWTFGMTAEEYGPIVEA